MKAWRVHSYGPYREVLEWEQVDDPSPPGDGALVRVAAAGLNFPDLLAISGQYQVKAPLPFTPGLEAVGEIVAVGDASRFSVGQRVIAYCPWGAYAELLAAPAAQLFPCPESMSDAAAAGLTITYQTAYFALVHRGKLESGETLLVHGGAGGVGSAAIQLGKHLGATVIATAGGADKCQVCTQLGADHAIDYRERDFAAAVKELTGGRGADVIYDPVGGEVFHQSSKCIAFGGRLLVIGFASGEIPSVKLNRVLLKNIDIVGLYWGAYQLQDPELVRHTHAELCRLYDSGAIAPLIHRELPLAELPEGLAALQARETCGKVIVTNR